MIHVTQTAKGVLAKVMWKIQRTNNINVGCEETDNLSKIQCLTRIDIRGRKSGNFGERVRYKSDVVNLQRKTVAQRSYRRLRG